MTDHIRHTPIAAPLALLSGLALALLAPLSAIAHDQIVEQSPIQNEHFDSSPAEIVLTFNDEPLDLGNIVMVIDASGNNHALGEPRIQNFTVTQPVAADLVDGYYQVRWRVVSSDGHPISESFLFSVGAVTDDTPKPTINSNNSTIEQDTTDIANSATDSVDPAFALDETVVSPDNGWRTAFFMLGGAVVAAIIVGLALLIRKPQRAKLSTTESSE